MADSILSIITTTTINNKNNHHECGKPDCKILGTKRCSGCLIELYCSTECQKKEWKIHRILCICMKDSNRLLSFEEIQVVVFDVLRLMNKKDGTRSGIRIAEYLLSLIVYPYGERIEGKSYRERNSSIIENYMVEVIMSRSVCNYISENYFVLDKYRNSAMVYFQKAL